MPDQPSAGRQRRPRRRHSGPAGRHRRVGGLPSTGGQGAEERISHAQTHADLSIRAGHHHPRQLVVDTEENLDERRFADPRRTTQVNDPRLAPGRSVSLLGQD
jgi:hypothetical protein